MNRSIEQSEAEVFAQHGRQLEAEAADIAKRFDIKTLPADAVEHFKSRNLWDIIQPDATGLPTAKGVMYLAAGDMRQLADQIEKAITSQHPLLRMMGLADTDVPEDLRGQMAQDWETQQLRMAISALTSLSHTYCRLLAARMVFDRAAAEAVASGQQPA